MTIRATDKTIVRVEIVETGRHTWTVQSYQGNTQWGTPIVLDRNDEYVLIASKTGELYGEKVPVFQHTLTILSGPMPTPFQQIVDGGRRRLRRLWRTFRG